LASFYRISSVDRAIHLRI